MPNIKSVVKDVKKSRELRLRNLSTRSKIKTFVKKTKIAQDSASADAVSILNETVSIVDKAANSAYLLIKIFICNGNYGFEDSVIVNEQDNTGYLFSFLLLS